MPDLPKQHVQISAIRTPPTGQMDYFGTGKDAGLILRVSYGGTKTWFVRYYTNRLGKRVRAKCSIGRFPRVELRDARIAMRDILADVDKGNDPAAERKRERSFQDLATVNDLSEQFFKLRERQTWRGRKRRNLSDEQGMADNYILPEIGSIPPQFVTEAEIDKVLDKVQEKSSAVRANRVLALMRVMFKHAVRRKWIPVNPCENIQNPGDEVPRIPDHPSDAEIRELWRRIEKGTFSKDKRPITISAPIQLALKLLLITGQRSSEVSQASIEEFDLNSGVWIISGDRTKNGKPHKVPLSPLAISIVQEAQRLARKEVKNCKWLFPGWPGQRGNKMGQIPIGKTAPNHALKRVLEGSKLKRFCVHDFRKICATQMAELSVPLDVVAAILNHSVNTVTARHYAKAAYEPQKREALQLWSDWLEGRISGDAARVVAILGKSP